jgi:HEAT repeats
VRSQTAEALGHLLPFHSHSDEIDSAITEGLGDDSPEVRFWCVFAAAALHLTDAVPRLRALARDDHVEIPGWWEIATEAQWAIRTIEDDPRADDLLLRSDQHSERLPQAGL